MSTLLSGPSCISPWMEDVAFQSFTKGVTTIIKKPKLVQVVSRGGYGWTNETIYSSGEQRQEPFLVIHDGQHSIKAFLNETAQTSLGMMIRTTATTNASAETQQEEQLEPNANAHRAKRGSFVRISDWTLALRQQAESQTTSHTTNATKNGSTAVVMEINGTIDIIGGEDMGLIGNPINVNESVQVRRVFQSNTLSTVSFPQLQHQFLYGPEKLGNVSDLFSTRTPPTTATTPPTTKTTNTNDTENETAAAATEQCPNDNNENDTTTASTESNDVFKSILELAKQQQQQQQQQEGTNNNTTTTTTMEPMGNVRDILLDSNQVTSVLELAKQQQQEKEERKQQQQEERDNDKEGLHLQESILSKSAAPAAPGTVATAVNTVEDGETDKTAQIPEKEQNSNGNVGARPTLDVANQQQQQKQQKPDPGTERVTENGITEDVTRQVSSSLTGTEINTVQNPYRKDNNRIKSDTKKPDKDENLESSSEEDEEEDEEENGDALGISAMLVEATQDNNNENCDVKHKSSQENDNNDYGEPISIQTELNSLRANKNNNNDGENGNGNDQDDDNNKNKGGGGEDAKLLENPFTPEKSSKAPLTTTTTTTTTKNIQPQSISQPPGGNADIFSTSPTRKRKHHNDSSPKKQQEGSKVTHQRSKISTRANHGAFAFFARLQHHAKDGTTAFFLNKNTSTVQQSGKKRPLFVDIGGWLAKNSIRSPTKKSRRPQLHQGYKIID